MYLIQILLPLFNNSGRRFPAREFKAIKASLTKRFNGLTAYSRVPAEGSWQKKRSIQREDIIVYEVMVTKLEAKWWRSFRLNLEERFKQESIVIRAQNILIL